MDSLRLTPPVIEMRDDRRLYKATVTAMFPELFAIPRADTASYATFWTDVVWQQRGSEDRTGLNHET